MATPYRLSETDRVTTYTVFEENQVLTSRQLNDLTDHLDQQVRLTRARLVGVGIVCGLDVAISRSAVTVGRGVAATSDGDLLEVDPPLSLGRFKPFTDEDAKYPLFRSGQNLLPLFELVKDGGLALESFEAETGRTLDSMVAVLYLESYRYDPDLCTGTGCDNKGQEARNNLKVLLVDGKSAPLLFGDPALLTPRYPLLSRYALPRVILQPKGLDDIPDLESAYRRVVKEAIPTIQERLRDTWKPLIRPLLTGLYDDADPTLRWADALDRWLSAAGGSLPGFQYLYDFLRDLAQAYAEFKDALLDEEGICVPPVGLFPKHVLLGGTGEQAALRHGFYASPAVAGRSAAVERIRFLHKRIDALVRLFEAPQAASAVRITPSRRPGAKLGSQAVPYYYKPDANGPITAAWSFEATRRGLQNSVYGYHAGALGGSAEAKAPLDYDLSGTDFFRIEGHLRGDVDAVEKELARLIARFNLPIRVLSLQIETGVPPLKVRPIGPMRDLKAMHRFYRQDLLMHLDDIRSFTTRVKDTIQEAPDLPEKDVHADTLSFKGFIDDGAKELDQAIEKVKTGLMVRHDQFQGTQFKVDYKSAVQKAAGINKGVRGVTYTSAFTPYETLVNDSKFKWLDWIDAILQKRREQAERLSVLGRFLEEAPAMEHLGGVVKGGTFILVYSAGSRKVVADFSLPYWHVDVPEPDEPEEEPAVASDVRWIDFNDLIVKRSDTKVLTDKLDRLQQKFDLADLRLQGQEDALRIYSGSLKTYTDAIFDTSVGMAPSKERFEDEVLGAQAELIEMIGNYVAAMDKKAAAGRITPEEEAMKKQMEAAGGEIITHAVEGFQKTGADITPNSDAERFMKAAVETGARMSDPVEKERLSNRMKEIKGTADASEMTNMNRMIDNFILP